MSALFAISPDTADRIGVALRGRRHGRGWLVSCPCPSHGSGRGDRNPSLSISDGDDGKLLMRCFAGCDFTEILDALRNRGLVDNGRRLERRDPPKIIPLKIVPPKIEPDPVALDIWQNSKPPHNSIVQEYLERRGILLMPPAIAHYRGDMIVAVHQPYASITAIQKTSINVDLTRGTRWTKGPLGNGAVRLGAAQEIMGIAEGTETALSAMHLTGMTVWASLGSERLHNVDLPPFVREVHIFADNDEKDQGLRAAHRAADIHCKLGRTVKIRRPPPQYKDYNDFIVADADAWAEDELS
jgi:putative DNA primase/helicase